VMVHPFSDGNGRMGRCRALAVIGIHGPEFLRSAQTS
jgi:hypothetical protein